MYSDFTNIFIPNEEISENFFLFTLSEQQEIMNSECLSFDIIFKMNDIQLNYLCDNIIEQVKFVILYYCIEKLSIKTIFKYLKRIHLQYNILKIDYEFQEKIISNLLKNTDIYDITCEEIELLDNLLDKSIFYKFVNKLDMTKLNIEKIKDCNKILFNDSNIILKNLNFLESNNLIGIIYNNNITRNLILQKFFSTYLKTEKLLYYIKCYKISFLTIEQILLLKDYYNQINLNFITLLDKDIENIENICIYLLDNMNKKKIKGFINNNLHFNLKRIKIFTEIVEFLQPIQKKIFLEKIFKKLNNKNYNLFDELEIFLKKILNEKFIEYFLKIYKKLSLNFLKFLIINYQNVFKNKNILFLLLEQESIYNYGLDGPNNECFICRENKNLISLYTCNHLMCNDCIISIIDEICPFCRSKIEKKLKINISII